MPAVNLSSVLNLPDAPCNTSKAERGSPHKPCHGPPLGLTCATQTETKGCELVRPCCLGLYHDGFETKHWAESQIFLLMCSSVAAQEEGRQLPTVLAGCASVHHLVTHGNLLHEHNPVLTWPILQHQVHLQAERSTKDTSTTDRIELFGLSSSEAPWHRCVLRRG